MALHNLVYNNYGNYMTSSSTISNQLGKMINYFSYTNIIINTPPPSLSSPSKLNPPPPNHQRWIPPNHGYLFQMTSKKLSQQPRQESYGLRKKLLLKQMLTKLQPNKRHAMILLPMQTLPQPNSQPLIYPPQPTYHPHSYRSYYKPKVKLPCPKINTSMIQRKRHNPPSPTSPPIPSKSICNVDDDDDDIPLGTLISKKP
ncbi:unnamed protein product [Cunninghamella echinulata]